MPRYIHYSRYTGEDLGIEADDLLKALADFLLESGFQTQYSQFGDWNKQERAPSRISRRPSGRRSKIVALAMFLVLFLFTGSLVIPVKAIPLTLLSLSASFGAMVFIFQDGHLLFLVGHPIVTGTVDTTMPLLMFCVAFGLSMDYEVFLLSRIRETYLETRDNRRAVAVGLSVRAGSSLPPLRSLPWSG